MGIIHPSRNGHNFLRFWKLYKIKPNIHPTLDIRFYYTWKSETKCTAQDRINFSIKNMITIIITQGTKAKLGIF